MWWFALHISILQDGNKSTAKIYEMHKSLDAQYEIFIYLKLILGIFKCYTKEQQQPYASHLHEFHGTWWTI